MTAILKEAGEKIARYSFDDDSKKKQLAAAGVIYSYVAQFEHEMTTGSLIVYSKALSVFTAKQLENAFESLKKTENFFPSTVRVVDQIYSDIVKTRRHHLPAAEEAWQEVVQKVRGQGEYAAWKYSCEAVKETAEKFGKDKLCAITPDTILAVQKEFMRLYDETAEKYANT